MKPIAHWIARRVWWAMLWFIRRPKIRRLQRMGLNLVPESRRERARQNTRRQEQWARRYGLTILTWSFTFLLYVVVATLAYLTVLRIISEGWIDIARQSVNR